MRPLALIGVVALLVGCTSMQANTDHRQQRIQWAEAEAVRIGNSSPLYNLYEDCLNLHWLDALDAGNDDIDAYQTGVDQCSSELTSLCDYYDVSTCKQDAVISHRVLFSVLMQRYRQITQN